MNELTFIQLYLLYCIILYDIDSTHCFNGYEFKSIIKEKLRIANGGSLGSCNDEERSKMRYVMWIADPVNHRIFERKLRCSDEEQHVCMRVVIKWWSVNEEFPMIDDLSVMWDEWMNDYEMNNDRSWLIQLLVIRHLISIYLFIYNTQDIWISEGIPWRTSLKQEWWLMSQNDSYCHCFQWVGFVFHWILNYCFAFWMIFILSWMQSGNEEDWMKMKSIEDKSDVGLCTMFKCSCCWLMR